MSGPLRADPEAVIAFRLHGHHLAQRLPHRASPTVRSAVVVEATRLAHLRGYRMATVKFSR